MLPRNVVSISAVITAMAAEQLWLPSMRLLQQMSCWPLSGRGMAVEAMGAIDQGKELEKLESS